MTTAMTTRPETMPARITPELTYREMLDFAAEMLKTGFLPRGVDTPAKAVAIILTGREMGMGTMQSLRSIAIVQGKPLVAADLQLGIFKRAGGHAAFRELTEEKAVLWLQHPNGDEHVETYTIEDAQAAGLTGKDNWKHYRKAMLRSRAITAGLKSIGFEPMSQAYDPSEIEGSTELVEIEAAVVEQEQEKPKEKNRDGDSPAVEKEKRHLWALIRELGLSVTEADEDGEKVTVCLFPPEAMLAMGFSEGESFPVRLKTLSLKQRRAAIASLEEIRSKVGAA